MTVIPFGNYSLKKLSFLKKKNMEAEPLELEEGEVIDDEVGYLIISLFDRSLTYLNLKNYISMLKFAFEIKLF